MIAITAMAIPRFLDFPAVSLPRLRFDRKIAVKLLIRADFWYRGEPRKNFSLSFPERQGTGGGATPLFFALSAPPQPPARPLRFPSFCGHPTPAAAAGPGGGRDRPWGVRPWWRPLASARPRPPARGCASRRPSD